ncbi:MAG TPA: carboxypeptidase regulatory-like domain-containing protein [Terriglobales bacterium]|nr:carboxypeptidase regulatory-like domain-containing protein [Terriglobales bacterium]
MQGRTNLIIVSMGAFMFRVRLILSMLLALCLVVVLGGSSHAQIFPGRITGTVLDSSGGAIEGAQVVLSGAEIGLERSVKTDSNGAFHFQELPLATFTLTVTKNGFKSSVQTNISTSLNRVNEINVTLVPGRVEVRVEVSAAAPILETETDTVGGNITAQEVTELPMGNSDYTRFAFLLPGTSTNTAYTFTQIAINGAPSRSVSFNIDGSQNMDAYRQLPAMNQGGNSYTAATRLPPDGIQEMSVVTEGAADTEAGAGAINVVLKSGTNDFHGSLYEQHRDASLTAHNYFENLAGIPKAHFVWNEYGGSFGGPIIKNKTFFYGAYDGGRSRLGSSTLAFAPSTAEIQQVETALAGATPPQTPNPLGLAILKLYQPYSGQFAVSGVGSQSPDSFSVKIDHRLGTSDQLAGRYLFGNGKDNFPQGSDSPTGGSQLPQYYGVTPIRPQNFAISESHTFSPKLINVFRLSYNHVYLKFLPADNTFNPNSIDLDTGASPENYGLPEIDLGAGVFENLGTDPSYPRQRTSETFQWNDDAAFSRGKHSFQFGANWELNKVFGFNNDNFRGLLTFDGSQVGDTLFPNTTPASPEISRLEALTDLLAGLPDPSATNISRGSTRFDIHQNVIGLYANDTYQLTHKLTLIAGLRWDFFGVPQEDRGRFSNFLPSQGLVPIHGDIYNNVYKNFSPRVAFAYSPFAFHGLHTVIRAGYGIYYVDSPLDVLVGQTFNLTNSNPGLATNPINGLGIYTDPLVSTPIQPNVPIFGTGLVPTPPFNLVAVNPNLKPPYVQSWNLNVEQELMAAMVLQIGYVGSKGTHIYGYPDVNMPPPSPVDQGNSTAEQLARPYYSQYPQFGQINTISSINNSSYNSLQIQLKTKNYHGLTTEFAYTWAHAIDEASETMDFFGTSGFVPKDSMDPKANRANSEFDVPQAISASYVYQFPSFTHSKGMGYLVNQWQLSGVVTWHDSMYLPVLTYDDISGTGEFHDVPNCVGPLVTQLKNFTIPYVVSGYAEPSPGTFGNCARNSLPAPWLTQWDFSVAKWFPIGERVKLQFRADGFNFLNHTNFGNPESSLGAEFVTGTADSVNNDSHFGEGSQRQFQLNMKLVF